MPFVRAMIGAPGMVQRNQPAQGFLDNVRLTVNAVDANAVLTADQFQGAILFSGFTAGRTVTTPTGAAIETANPGMNIDDAFFVMLSTSVAFAGTLTAAAGITLAGKTTVPASASVMLHVRKTALNTFTVTAL